MRQVDLAIKRAVDFLGSGIGLIVVSPIFLITVILMELFMPGPVFFKQQRVGKNGTLFNILKFRSMKVDKEAEKSHDFTKDAERMTPFGNLIRRLKIDELPQLFNVLINDMSLVGTRPPTVDEVEQYERDHWRRISIKPGITGMWQISGRSSITNFEEVVQLDVSYIDGWNILRDLRIIFQTVGCVLKKQGAC